MLVEIFPHNYSRRVDDIGSGERDAAEHVGVGLRRIVQDAPDAEARNDPKIAISQQIVGNTVRPGKFRQSISGIIAQGEDLHPGGLKVG